MVEWDYVVTEISTLVDRNPEIICYILFRLSSPMLGSKAKVRKDCRDDYFCHCMGNRYATAFNVADFSFCATEYRERLTIYKPG